MKSQLKAALQELKEDHGANRVLTEQFFRSPVPAQDARVISLSAARARKSLT